MVLKEKPSCISVKPALEASGIEDMIARFLEGKVNNPICITCAEKNSDGSIMRRWTGEPIYGDFDLNEILESGKTGCLTTVEERDSRQTTIFVRTGQIVEKMSNRQLKMELW